MPIRLELGPKDMENQSVLLARRDTGVKETVAWADVSARVPELLEQIQVRLHPCLKPMLSVAVLCHARWLQSWTKLLYTAFHNVTLHCS